MVQVFVFQETPVFFIHLTEKGMLPGKVAVPVSLQVFFQRFQQMVLLRIKVTFKINDKFPKSRHISRNSVVEDLHFPFCKSSDGSE